MISIGFQLSRQAPLTERGYVGVVSIEIGGHIRPRCHPRSGRFGEAYELKMISRVVAQEKSKGYSRHYLKPEG
jgi:hypothetical protein